MMNKVALSIDIYSHISVNKNNRMCSFIFLRVDPMIYIYIYHIPAVPVSFRRSEMAQ